MDTQCKIQTLQADPVAADVSTATAGYILIKGLPPIRTEDYIGATFVAPAAEVQQVRTIGGASAVTIAAATKYQIGIGNTGDQREGWQNTIKKFSGQIAALSGTAATDRFNVYAQIVSKAMSSFRQNQAYVGVACTVTCAAGTAFTYSAANGPVFVKGSVSGCVGFMRATSSTTVLALNITNGIIPAAGDVFSLIPDPYTGRNPTGTGGPSGAWASSVLGLNIVVMDVAGYYSAKGTRKGVNTVVTTAGFAANNADVATTVAGVYSIGQGARLLQDLPVQDTRSSNLVSGQWYFPTNDIPVAGSQYEIIEIGVRPMADISALSDIGGISTMTYRIYANIAGTTGGYAAYAAAIAAL